MTQATRRGRDPVTDSKNHQSAMIEQLLLTWATTYDGVPTEDELKETLELFRAQFGPDLSGDDATEMFDSVSKKLAVRMDIGTVIEDERYEPWLADRRTEIDWALWAAYTSLLIDQGRAPVVVDSMNRSLDLILDHLGNPADPTPWARRGLVIGDVQSGKTGTYIGLMDKAHDAGYRIFVILTGNTESLRRQTQERVDEGMLGRDSANALMPRRQGIREEKRNRIGVGLRLESVSGLASTTTILSDFNIASAKALNVVPGKDLSVIFVTKKNKRILDRIAGWLESQAGANGTLDLPLLFLDDEADYASVNTNKEDVDPTAINAAIRRILALSTRNSYVGFTATPFANIFINDEDDQDLFPRDFIYALDAPSNYLGALDLFSPAEEDEFEGDDGIRIIDDAEDVFPLAHRNHHYAKRLPPSLQETLRSFLLANAIRDLRGDEQTPRSMLVNVSRFNSVQAVVADLLRDELARYRNAINSHSATFARGVPNDEMSQLKRTFGAEFPSTEFDWEAVASGLMSAVADIEVRVVNARRDKDLEELQARIGPAGRTISIGGDLLSRGLTLEGLMTSYFYRRTAASDTLMQMGRWFGYREGYGDLCRIWLSAETVSSYASTADSLQELRLELDRMRVEGLTPQQYGIAVKSHPGALLITARNKMRAAVAGQKSISLRGRVIESASLSAVPADLKSNERAATEFFATLTAKVGEPSSARRGVSKYVWNEVPKTLVADFLSEFKAAPSATLFTSDSLERFVRSARADDLQSWDVVLMSGRGEAISFGGVTVNRPARKVRSVGDVYWISSAKRRVAGPGDVAVSLSDENLRTLRANYEARNPGPAKSMPDYAIVPHLKRPLLLVYPVEGNLEATEGKYPGSISSVLVSIVIAIPGSKTDISEQDDNVTYMLNAVAQRYWLADYDATEDDDDVD